MSAKAQFVKLPTQDGFPTQGHLYEAANNGDQSLPIAIIGPATGVPGRFYGPFASWLSSQHGIPTLIIDYRYCGVSFPEGVDTRDRKARTTALIEGKETSIAISWREDARAALQYIKERYPGRGVCWIGNSLGGHLLPLAQTSEDNVTRALFVCVNSPYHGYYEDPQTRTDGANLAIKLTHEEGYFPSAMLGLGEDIPAQCGIDWLRWTESPRYVASEFHEEYDAYTGRIFSLIFSDDTVSHAPARHAADKVLHTLPRANSTRIEVDPARMGWTPAGHVNAFRVDHKDDIWKGLLLWIQTGEIWSAFEGDRWDSSGYGPGQSPKNSVISKM